MVRKTRGTTDPAVQNLRLGPCPARVSGPTRLSGGVSAYSQTPKRRNLWEETTRKSSDSAYRFPFMGSTNPLPDYPRTCVWPTEQVRGHRGGRLRNRRQQFEIIVDCGRVDFCPRDPASVDNFLPVASRHVSNKFSLWTVRRGNRPGLRVHAAASRFSTFGPTEPSHCGSGKPPKAARPTASDRHGEHLPHRSPAPGPIRKSFRADVKIRSMTKLTVAKSQVAPGKAHLSVPHWVRQTVSIAIPLNGRAT